MFLASTNPQRLRLIQWSQAPDADPAANTLIAALREPQLPSHVELREELYRMYCSAHAERKRVRQRRQPAPTIATAAVTHPGNGTPTPAAPEETSHNHLEGARIGEAQNPGPPRQYSSDRSTYLSRRRLKRRTSPGPRPQARQASRQPPHRNRHPFVTSSPAARRPPSPSAAAARTTTYKDALLHGRPANSPAATHDGPTGGPNHLPAHFGPPHTGGTARPRDPPPSGRNLGFRPFHPLVHPARTLSPITASA